MALIAASLALGLSTVGFSHQASAQAPQNTPLNMLTDVGEDEVIMITPKGRVAKSKITKGKGHFQRMTKLGGREITGAMIVRRGGKLYLLEDKPAAGGKTMVQSNFQDVFELSTY